MGIKNLLKLLKMYPGLVQEKKFTDYKGKKIAIDISILLYQSVIAIRNSGSDLVNNKGDITSHILGLFNKTINLLKNNIIPVYVFDGKAPELKKKVLTIRRNRRKESQEKMIDAETSEEKIKYFKRTVSISKKQHDECRELLKLMGVPYVNAPGEADAQCAWLAKNNYVDAVLTEDMDILTFGSPIVIKYLSSKKKSLEINLEKIKEVFGWTHNQFIELCVLLGCDYAYNITKVTYLKLFHEFQKCKDIKKVLNNIKMSIDYKEPVEYFNKPDITTSIKRIVLKKIKYKEVEELLLNKYGLVKYKVKSKLKYVKTLN
jgi:flap endonuclease-1